MNSLILRVVGRLLVPLMLLFSVFLLLRGHNEPGGGFVGGLMAVGAFGLYSLTYGVATASKALFVDPRTLVGLGLLLAVLSCFGAVFIDAPLLAGGWFVRVLAPAYPLHVGTPTVFDVGVYLVVIGGVLLALFAVEDD